MIPEHKKLFGRPASHRLAFIVVVIVYVLIQVRSGSDFFNYMKLPDNDDAMRMVSLRDFLTGQSWYDYTQHRVLPPDGLSLHWSRLVDAGLAAVALFFMWFTDLDTALHLTAAAWPALLFLIYLVLITRTTRSVFGYSAASFAAMAVAMVPMVGGVYFPLGRVDHHNVQFICMALICAAIIRPERPLANGITAGAAASLSLAVGLEAIVFPALAMIILSVQHVVGQDGSTRRMLGYAGVLGGLTPLLFMVQTDPALWSELRCDQLSMRTLSLSTGAAIFALVLAFATKAVKPIPARFGIALVAGTVVSLAIWPIISPCQAGPYAEISPLVREVIIPNIIEAASITTLLSWSVAMAAEILLPLFLTTALTVVLLLSGEKAGLSRQSRSALIVICVFMVAGALGSLLQARASVWGYAVAPMAMGVVISTLASQHWRKLNIIKPVIVTGLAITILLPSLVTRPAAFLVLLMQKPAATAESSGQTGDSPGTGFKSLVADCSAPDQIARLNQLAPSVILAWPDFGSHILLYTHHSVTSAPYHRNPDALESGVMSFLEAEQEMRDRVAKHGVTHVLLCAGTLYGPPTSFGSQLGRGEYPAWLTPVDIETGPLTVLRVIAPPQE